jgi:hypothetical protein
MQLLARVPVPRWVDVVLEGGWLHLERALVEYRALTKLLAHDWQHRALEVQALARTLAARELDTVDAEARARHRSSFELELRDAAQLAEAVGRAREALCRALQTSPEHLCAALAVLEQNAEEAAMVARAWRQFTGERTGWTLLSLAALGLAPLLSYASASTGGMPVRFDLTGLTDSIAVLGLLTASALALAAQARREFWAWLKPFKQSWALTLALAGATALGCLPVFPRAGALVAIVASAWLSLRAVWPWWRR